MSPACSSADERSKNVCGGGGSGLPTTTTPGSSPSGSTPCSLTGADARRENPQYLSVIGRNAPVAPHTLSSQVASAMSTATFYPIDVVKTRFMAQDGTKNRQHNGRTYTSILGALRVIYREEGVRTLFRGCHVAVCGTVVSWGMYMYLYRELCNLWSLSSWAGRASISVIASLIASFLSSPIWLIKSRMQLEERSVARNYTSVARGVRHAVSTHGFRSLWRGVSLQLLLVFPNAMTLPTYDFLKGLLLHREGNRGRSELTAPEVMLCTATAKIAIIVVSHPMSTVKMRLQDVKWNEGPVKYVSVRNAVMVMWRREGFRGLYRGFTSAILHTLPRSLVQYVLYEKILNLLIRTQTPPAAAHSPAPAVARR